MNMMKTPPLNRSFASHNKAIYWSDKNGNIKPTDVYKSTSKKYIFNCDNIACGHEFEISPNKVTNGVWCSYCSNRRLCDDLQCKVCFDKSFASQPTSKFWSDRNVGVIPRQVFKSSGSQYKFNCFVCDIEISRAPNSIISQTKDKIYCHLCSFKNFHENKIIPYEKSFASHEKSINWSDKNILSPVDLSKCSHDKFWFKCENVNCNHTFDIALNCVVGGKWCSYCSNPPRRLCDDLHCSPCYNKSFASHPKAHCWSIKNGGNIKPRDVFLSSSEVYTYTCDVCLHDIVCSPNHLSNGKWCAVCTHQKLCDDQGCKLCFETSFASHPKSTCWSYSNNGTVKPRDVFQKTPRKYWFKCDNKECNHLFKGILSEISGGGWCAYCSSPPKQLCDDTQCTACFKKSFASHPKASCWVDEKNGEVTPRNVFVSAKGSYWFRCDKCTYLFEIRLYSISAGHWCSSCKNKTEFKFYEIVKNTYPSILRQFKQNWCIRKRELPFDFCIPEHKIIIEIDGPQHFQQVSNWKCPIETHIDDKFKEKCANDNGYHTIRLPQSSVLSDEFDWEKEVHFAIQIINNNLDTNVTNTYLCVNYEYDDWVK